MVDVMLLQVDLTKYTEQHEFYFDEVARAVTCILRVHHGFFRCFMKRPPTPKFT
jgi:hypothetical protein